MRTLILIFATIVAVAPQSVSQDKSSPLERYRRLEYSPTVENFDQGWRDRVALEFEIINDADLDSLRAALKDENAFVRALAARALGILADRSSIEDLNQLVQFDPEPMVRIRAVESLSLLKAKPDVIERAKKDSDAGVAWTVELIAGQCQSDIDYAQQLRVSFAGGISPDEMGLAQVGLPAPDFTAVTTDGKPFRLSDVLGKKAIAIYFAAFDG